MPRDSSRTRQLLLDTAQDLVAANGFAGTSVDQILEISGSSKGAFFHHFPNKKALAHALVERWVDGDLEMLAAGVAATEPVADPVEKVQVFLAHYETWAETLVAEDTSCLYIATLAERDLMDEATVGEVERSIKAWRGAVASLLVDAYAATGLTAAAGAPEPDELADHLFATFEGAFLLCRAQRSADPMREQLRVYRQLVTALLQTSS